MRPLPTDVLDPRIKTVWRVNDGFWVVLAFIICAAPFALAAAIEPELWVGTVLLIEIIVFAVLFIVVVFVLPPIRYIRWRYELTEDYLDIARGIIWRKRFIIPFIRVQNTDTRQGPIMRMFGLASVTVATAADNHEIPGLSIEKADQLRDKAAELARLAREDV